uniref:Ig-like domain-containing protein n=1 Tax=Rhabditophanes sp. KR3021 TaxID=114890 RepID=A0AC35UF96_9BILA
MRCHTFELDGSLEYLFMRLELKYKVPEPREQYVTINYSIIQNDDFNYFEIEEELNVNQGKEFNVIKANSDQKLNLTKIDLDNGTADAKTLWDSTEKTKGWKDSEGNNYMEITEKEDIVKLTIKNVSTMGRFIFNCYYKKGNKTIVNNLADS